MKNVGIVSCYYKANYGSMLQAYAIQRFLDTIGVDNETIDISSMHSEILKGKLKYYTRNIFNFEMYDAKKGFIRHIIHRKIDKIGFGANISKRGQAFERFSNEHFRLSNKIKSKKELSQACRNYTDVLVGSDQLWLPVNIEADYYTLNFVPEHINKVAFATSFGVPEIPTYLNEKTERFLNRIEHISVREYSGQKIIKQLVGRDVPVVCDPTLLFTGEQWVDIQKKNSIITQKYILCYFLGNNPEHRLFANRLKEKTGLPIVVLRHINEYIPSDDKFGDIALYDIGPDDFINLIRYAEYVCTDSYHGTVFSILNQKVFFVFNRFKKSNSQSTNTRLESLLSMLEVNHRLIQPNSNVDECLEKRLDYDCVNQKLNLIRGKSIHFLKNSLDIA
jgi:hypothetical protein